MWRKEAASEGDINDGRAPNGSKQWVCTKRSSAFGIYAASEPLHQRLMGWNTLLGYLCVHGLAGSSSFSPKDQVVGRRAPGVVHAHERRMR